MPQIENAVVERIDESGSQLSLMRTTLAANRTHLVNFHLASASEGGFAPCLKALAFRGQQGFFREDREEFVACSRVEIEMD